MPDIAGLLKSEISRLSKKAVREHLSSIQSATASHRHQLAALKKQVLQLERELARLRRAAPGKMPATDSVEGTKIRFVAKGLKSLRSRLGLGAEDFGLLLGVSSQSVYNWENQKTVPRKVQVAAIAQLRSLGKREARARIESLAPASSKGNAQKA
ncbi:MAG: helix-turn-helix domain-containing protein [Stenotrophobium sp.]